MKRALIILMAAGIGFAVASLLVFQQQTHRHADDLAKRQKAWDAEKAELEKDLALARNHSTAPTIVRATQSVLVTNTISPTEILGRLKTMKAVSSQPRSVREVVHQFESLIEAGPSALPVIREFLASKQEIEYEAGIGRGFRDGRVP